MLVADTVIDDPHLLKHIMSTAKPSKSRVGRMMETSRTHLQPYFGAKKQEKSFTKNERESQLQLQRELQTAWDVSAERKLQLPLLRTMAPSFTKADDGVDDGMGGVVLGEVGYRTIIGMVPTAERVRRIADDDELISSFRQYRIDVLRAARQAETTPQCVPHPDEARRMEPTLCALASNRLIDAGAVPGEVARKHWAVSSVFAAGDVGDDAIAAPSQPATPADARLLAKARQPRRVAPTGTSSFLATPRFKTATKFTGVRQPDVGHYHLKYSVTEPQVVGGYIAPRESAAPQRRPPREKSPEPAEAATETKLAQTTPELLASENTKIFAFSTIGGLNPTQRSAAVTEATSEKKKKRKPTVRGDHMFVSKTPRVMAPNCSAAKDLDYFPYADVRSTVKRICCPVKFDVALHQPRRHHIIRSQGVGSYNVATDIANNPHRIVCMDRSTGREGFWLNKTVLPDMIPGYVDLSNALNKVRPRVRAAIIALQKRKEDSEKRQKAPDPTVSIERDLNFPRSVFDRCEARRVRQFATMTGRSETVPAVSHEAPESIDMTHVTKRIPNVIIHPSAPGHAPLHQQQKTEIGEVPNLKWVKPTTERTTNFGIAPSVHFSQQQPARDLWYDTTKRSLVEPRVTGNPMIELQVSRDKRAKMFSTNGCGAHVVYETDIPQRCKSVPLFEKQITKEAQFCGHRLQSERWLQKHPRAPGPGHYNVSYALVE